MLAWTYRFICRGIEDALPAVRVARDVTAKPPAAFLVVGLASTNGHETAADANSVCDGINVRRAFELQRRTRYYVDRTRGRLEVQMELTPLPPPRPDRMNHGFSLTPIPFPQSTEDATSTHKVDSPVVSPPAPISQTSIAICQAGISTERGWEDRTSEICIWRGRSTPDTGSPLPLHLVQPKVRHYYQHRDQYKAWRKQPEENNATVHGDTKKCGMLISSIESFTAACLVPQLRGVTTSSERTSRTIKLKRRLRELTRRPCPQRKSSQWEQQ